MIARLRNKGLFLVIIAALSFFPDCGGRVVNLGVFGESRKTDVLGQDGVTPVPLSPSCTMWTFGDTIIGKWKHGVSAEATFQEKVNTDTMLSNSVAFTERPNAENVRALEFNYYKKNGKVVQFINYKDGEDPGAVRLWALDGIRIRDAVYVYYLKIKIDNPRKTYGFSLQSVGLARWHMPENWKMGDPVRFERIADLFPGSYPAFGACVIERDGFIYTIGQYVRDGRSPVVIARVKKEDIEKSDKYEFVTNGGSWDSSIKNAVPLFGDVMGECSLSYNEHLGKFVIIYCQMFTGSMVFVTFGDFTDINRIYKTVIYKFPPLPSSESANSWYYSGKEIFTEGRYIYAVCMHPREYQPYLIQIKL